ncbi:MAG: M16 family metallopeptidase [Bacteroidales bacterium]
MTTTVNQGLAPSREVLSNGAIVIAKETHTTPAVTISATFPAGSIFDPPDRGGLSHFLSRIIDRGTVNRSAEEIAELMDGRGVSLTVIVTRHLLTLTCTCLTEDFQTMLELVGETCMQPTFPEPEIGIRRAEIVTAIRQDADNPAVVAVEGLMALLYPGQHPYGRPAKGSIDSVSAIDRADLQAFHGRTFTPAGLCLVIVGDVEAAEANRQANRVFGGWRGVPAVDGTLAAPPPATSRRRLVVPMMNKVQADVAYGFVTIARHDPGYYAFLLMNNLLGQYALGGRLGDSIRERQGMAYYVFSAFDANISAGPLVIRAGVDRANVDKAVASIDEELRRLAAEGATEKEVTESKQYLIGSMPRNLETNAAIAAFLQNVEYFDLGLDYDVRLPALIEQVTLGQVNEQARRFLVPDRAALVIAGPYEDNR